MKKIKIILLFVTTCTFIFNSCATHSQAILLYKGEVYLVLDDNCTMTGRVVDKNTNKPIGGAYILFEGTTIGASADYYGNYSIGRIPPGSYNIKVGYLGFEYAKLINFVFEKSHYYLVDFELTEEPIVVPH